MGGNTRGGSSTLSEPQQRRTRLTREQKWQIFSESSREKNSTQVPAMGSLPGNCGRSATASRTAPPVLGNVPGRHQGHSDHGTERTSKAPRRGCSQVSMGSRTVVASE